MSILLNGEIVSDETVPLRPSATLWRGQGYFETIAVKDGTLYNVGSHVDRLVESLPPEGQEGTDWQQVQTQFGELAQSENVDEGRAKLIVWKQDGNYHHAGWIKPYTPLSSNQYREGISLDVQLRSHPPRWPLSHEKRTSYASVMKEREDSPGWDVVYCDLEGNVWETSITNILWYDRGTIVSPRMDGHWLPGTILESILETAGELGIKTGHRSAGWDELGSFCFVTNSLIGMAPVNSIATEEYDPTPPDDWIELRERLLSDKVFPRWHEQPLFK